MTLQANHIQRLFEHLDHWPPHRFPQRMALSGFLDSLIARRGSILSQEQAVLFTTAAIEMWHRAVHSLILAMALRQSSEIWSCVSGYYASHYSVRAYAHLFGYFALYQRKQFLEVSPYGGRFQCQPVSPLSTEVRREHRFYWGIIKKLPEFDEDPLFSENNDRTPLSDAAHRGIASYADHLNRFRPYEPIERTRIRAGIRDLAHVALAGEDSIAIPDRGKYPDLATVLSIAYLRIYRFREYLDELLLEGGGAFWRGHRTPEWSIDTFEFPPRSKPRQVPGPLDSDV